MRKFEAWYAGPKLLHFQPITPRTSSYSLVSAGSHLGSSVFEILRPESRGILPGCAEVKSTWAKIRSVYVGERELRH